ncbi:MAG: D-alanine--D-alanine ligase [Alphaproteobacteria bacterium]|nr:D-alanine--D-alanine ligase [Alphaproteobacteria bacterium]MCL2505680.1 D-alanine--D-alanine ligase [Alphaproteobacteria bacterium]
MSASTTESNKKTRVLFMFGGRSPEHDISILTSLNGINALDKEKFDVIPLYVSPDGQWFIGKTPEALLDSNIYIPSLETQSTFTRVTLNTSLRKTPELITMPKYFWERQKRIPFDVAFLGFLGLIGEDGRIQGMCEVANIPYTGMRVLASAVVMDKGATKKMLAGTDVPIIPHYEIKRPKEGVLITPAELQQMLPGVKFPCCVKPANLGSSIGVAKVNSYNDLSDTLASSTFVLDHTALLETFVENLVEYNVSVRKRKGKTVTSAIEKPKFSEEFFSFEAKYKTGDKGKGSKMGAKCSMPTAEGIASIHDLHPDITKEMDANIRKWATTVFDIVDGAGIPRLDFMCNSKTGEIWFNEANPFPTLFAYFLWEGAKENPVTLTELLEDMITEAFDLHAQQQIPNDPTLKEARLFPRR